MNTGEIIKYLRKEQNVTQEELASALNISAQSISKWEKGQANPDITFIPLLANFFHVSIETLFHDVDDNSDDSYEKGKNKQEELSKAEELDAVISLWENMHFRYPNDYRIVKELIKALCAKNDVGSVEKTFQYVILLLKNNENKTIENEVLDCLKAYVFNGKPVVLHGTEQGILSQVEIDDMFIDVRKQKIAGKRVLLVDDAPFMRKSQTDMLKKSGFQVVGEAENGLQAVELYKELKPDVVIMDIIMPKLDGISAIKKIKEINPEACVFVCSAMANEAVVADAKALGVNYFIAKPFQEARFINTIKAVDCSKNEKEREDYGL